MAKEFTQDLGLERKIRREVFKTLAIQWLFRLTATFMSLLLSLMVCGLFIFTPQIEFLLFRKTGHDLLPRFEIWIPSFLVFAIATLIYAWHESGKKEIQRKKLDDWLDINSDFTWRARILPVSRPELKEAAVRYIAELEKNRRFLEDGLAYLE